MILTATSELYQMQQVNCSFNLATQVDTRLHQMTNTSWQQSKAQ